MTHDTKHHIGPLVSIGLPVFNGELYLRQALDSILGQSYRNIEVIVADNASTDRTQEIIAEYMENDGRIKFHGSATNKGAAWNYNRTFHLSTGKYFKWAAHDDLLHTNYVLECVRVLEDHPNTVLCHSKVGQIDEAGAVQEHEYVKSEDFLDPDLSISERHRSLLLDRGAWTRIFGIMRSDALKNSPLIASYVGSDLTLLGEMGLKGNVRDIDEVMFWRREHSNTSTRGKYHARRNRLVWFRSGRQPLMNFPSWRVHFELLKNVFVQNIPAIDKFRCSVTVLKRAVRSWKELVEDIYYAASDGGMWIRSHFATSEKRCEQKS